MSDFIATRTSINVTNCSLLITVWVTHYNLKYIRFTTVTTTGLLQGCTYSDLYVTLWIKAFLAGEIIIIEYATLFTARLVEPCFAKMTSNPGMDVFRWIFQNMTDRTCHWTANCCCHVDGLLRLGWFSVCCATCLLLTSILRWSVPLLFVLTFSFLPELLSHLDLWTELGYSVARS